MKKQYWIIICAVVAVLAIGAGLFFWLGNNGPEPGKPQAFSYIYKDYKYYPLLNGQQNGDPFSIKMDDDTDDGSVACVWTDDDELILFTLTERKTIANNVNRFKLHSDGKAVTYSTHDKVLYRYDVETGNVQTLLEGFIDYLISSDNQTIAYINNSNALILKTSDMERQIAVLDSYPNLTGLANGGAHIHVENRINGETVISHYNANGQRTEILRSKNSRLYPQYGSMSQLLISPIDGPAYISIDGHPAVKVSDNWIEPMTPVTGSAEPDDLQNWPFWTAQGEIWYIESDPLNPIILAKDVGFAQCDPTGRYIWYAKDNNLMRMDVQDGADAEKNAVMIMENLLDVKEIPLTGTNYRDMVFLYMRFSPDCENIYYSPDDNLYLVDAMNGGERKLIAENLKYGTAQLKNGIVYYIVDSTLYSYWDGESTEILTDVEIFGRTDPYHLYAKLSDSTYYITDGVTSYNVTLNIA